MFWLGCLYLEDNATFKDKKKAVNWLEESAKLNEIAAINYLGDLYFEGKVEKQNIQKAKYWFQKSCDFGDEQGCENLKSLPLQKK